MKKNIKVTDKSRGTQKIKVRGTTLDLKNMSDEDIIRRTHFKEHMLDYHYSVNDEYKDVSDMTGISVSTLIRERRRYKEKMREKGIYV